MKTKLFASLLLTAGSLTFIGCQSFGEAMMSIAEGVARSMMADFDYGPSGESVNESSDWRSAGVGHDEPVDASLAGQYELTAKWSDTNEDGDRVGGSCEWDLILFDNGSFVRHLVQAKTQTGDDMENTSSGWTETGQWKTEGDQILIRSSAEASFWSWAKFESRSDGIVFVPHAAQPEDSNRFPIEPWRRVN